MPPSGIMHIPRAEHGAGGLQPFVAGVSVGPGSHAKQPYATPGGGVATLRHCDSPGAEQPMSAAEVAELLMQLTHALSVTSQ